MNKEDKVLIIHENSNIRNSLRDHLRKLGYSGIWGFDNTKNARDEIKNCKYKPNLIFLPEELYNLYEILKNGEGFKRYKVFTIGNLIPEKLEKIIESY